MKTCRGYTPSRTIFTFYYTHVGATLLWNRIQVRSTGMFVTGTNYEAKQGAAHRHVLRFQHAGVTPLKTVFPHFFTNISELRSCTYRDIPTKKGCLLSKGSPYIILCGRYIKCLHYNRRYMLSGLRLIHL